MRKAVIGLFHEVDEARSIKIMLESLGLMSKDTDIVLKEDYQEELQRLLDYGFHKDDLYDIDNGFKNGGIVLAIRPTGKYREVVKMLSANNATTIMTSDEQVEILSTNTLPENIESNKIAPKEIIKTNELVNDDNKNQIKLYEEKLDINKEKIQTGEVVLRTEVIEEVKTIQVPVIKEEIVVEKIDKTKGTDSVEEIMRIPVMEEEIKIDKVNVIKEKVDVKKIEKNDIEVINESLKKEELEVLRTGKNLYTK